MLCVPASAITVTVAEALDAGEAGGLGKRSTGHKFILCLMVGRWECLEVKSDFGGTPPPLYPISKLLVFSILPQALSAKYSFH